MSVSDSNAALSSELAKTEEQMHQAEADLAHGESERGGGQQRDQCKQAPGAHDSVHQ